MQFCCAVLVEVTCKGDLGGEKGRDCSSIPASAHVSCDLSLVHQLMYADVCVFLGHCFGVGCLNHLSEHVKGIWPDAFYTQLRLALVFGS